MGMDMEVVSMFMLGKRSWKAYEGKTLLMLGKQRISGSYNQFFKNAEQIGFSYRKEILSNLHLNLDRLMDSYVLFRLLGFSEVSAMDISPYEGANIVFDLRTPELNKELYEKFDIIFDEGTLEHIIDPIRAMDNIRKMLKIEGRVIHIVPSAQNVDHGLYQFSPIFFREYYEHKGFFIHHLDFLVTDIKGDERVTVLCSPDCRIINTREYVEKYLNFPGGHTAIRCIAVKEKNLEVSVMKNEGQYADVYESANKYGKMRKPQILSKLLNIINTMGKEQVAIYGYGETVFDIVDYIDNQMGNLDAIACIIHTKKVTTNYKGIPLVLLNELSDYNVKSVYIASLSSNANLIYNRICHLERKNIEIIKLYEL